MDTKLMDFNKVLQSYDLTNYSPEEIETLIQIITEVSMAEEGESTSPTLNYLYAIDYEEIPVDIDTFIEHDDYLGITFDRGKGIYPYWRQVLRDVFSSDSPFMEIVFSGAIGLGKSTIAEVGIAYILYQLLCLRNPQRYYGLQDSSYITIALINLSLDAVYAVGYRGLQEILKNSPWFLRNGRLKGKKGSETYVPNKRIEIVPASEPRHTIGRNVFCAFLDEMDFSQVADPIAARRKVMNLYTNIIRRMESRFMNAGKVPGKVFLVSSKNRSHDFLELYIKDNRMREDMYVVDEPIWVVKKEKLRLSGQTFQFAVGGRLLPHHILKDSETKEDFEKLGYRVISIPVEYRRSFESNVEKALNDIAGIATEAGSKFLDVELIKKVSGTNPTNPFTVEIMKIGLKSGYAIQDFFDKSRIDEKYRANKFFIHLDLSKTTDRTGITIGTYDEDLEVVRFNPDTGTESKVVDISYVIIGSMALEALPGSEIPYYRIKEFIDWFDDEYDVVCVTADGYQSLEMTQYYKLKNKESYVLSVDRYPHPYHNMVDAMKEGRFIVPDIQLLKKEWSELEVTEKGKIDHPYDTSGNPSGTKDMSDSVCGVTWSILSYKGMKSEMDQSDKKRISDLQVLSAAFDTDDDLYSI